MIKIIFGNSFKNDYFRYIFFFYHDSAACLLKNDNILTAVQEERFSRVKHDQNFPIQSILYCLNSNNLTPEKIDFVVFMKNPF